MKYIKSYNSINESWNNNLIHKLSFDYDNDLRMYFVDLLDIGFDETINHLICDEKFELKNRKYYMDDPLYMTYNIRYSYNKKISSDKLIDIMQCITTALEVLKEEGYSFCISELSIYQTEDNYRQRDILDIYIYNNKDIIPWEYIFSNDTLPIYKPNR